MEKRVLEVCLNRILDGDCLQEAAELAAKDINNGWFEIQWLVRDTTSIILHGLLCVQTMPPKSCW